MYKQQPQQQLCVLMTNNILTNRQCEFVLHSLLISERNLSQQSDSDQSINQSINQSFICSVSTSNNKSLQQKSLHEQDY